MTVERTVHQSGLATSDIYDLADYYLKQAGIDLALKFVDNAERAFEQLRAMPRIGALLGLDELPYEDLRRWHINGFPRLLIVYRETSDGVEIIRVLHGARDLPTLLR